MHRRQEHKNQGRKKMMKGEIGEERNVEKKLRTLGTQHKKRKWMRTPSTYQTTVIRNTLKQTGREKDEKKRLNGTRKPAKQE
jgi:hypothetical protein